MGESPVRLHRCKRVVARERQIADPLPRCRDLCARFTRRKAPRRVTRKARRDRQIGAVAQQTQRDVHPDLGATSGQQRPASGQVGPGLTALTGETVGALASKVDLLLNVPSRDAQRIQEAHITIGHIACSLIEQLATQP